MQHLPDEYMEKLHETANVVEAVDRAYCYLQGQGQGEHQNRLRSYSLSRFGSTGERRFIASGRRCSGGEKTEDQLIAGQ